jgi:hypothetical protein
VSLSAADEEAYLHVWNVIGYLLGVDERLLAHDMIQARELRARIERRQFAASPEGRAPSPGYASCSVASSWRGSCSSSVVPSACPSSYPSGCAGPEPRPSPPLLVIPLASPTWRRVAVCGIGRGLPPRRIHCAR